MQLPLTIGVVGSGGVVHPILEASTSLPARGGIILTTADDQQTVQIVYPPHSLRNEENGYSSRSNLPPF